MSRTIHRSAITGRFVTAEYAAAHPDTTISQTLRTPEFDETQNYGITPVETAS